MQRVLRDTGAEIEFLVTDAAGEGAQATGTPTVSLMRDSDGVTVTPSSVTHDEDGRYTATLAPTDIPEVDVLSGFATATVDSVANQKFPVNVEVVGGYLCSLKAIAGEVPDKTAAEYRAAREWAEDTLEQACGVAFRPRYRRVSLDGPGTGTLFAPDPRPTALLSASITGTDLTNDEIDAVTIRDAGVFERVGFWAAGDGNVALTYVHGHPVPPAPVRRAAVKLAAYFLTNDPSDYFDRATSLSTEDGATYSLVTPGVRGASTPIPEVNQVIEEFRYV